MASSVSYASRPRKRRPEPPILAVLPPRPPLAPLDMAELAALESLPMRARRLADAVGIGGHRSRRKGASVEFADYRDYQPGDDLRRVDWRLYGRTDRLHLRDAHEETPLRIVLLLDVSASMSYASRPGLLTKLDAARSLLGAIALLARRQRDACGVGLLADDLIHYLPPSASPLRLRSAWGALETPKTAVASALGQALSRTADASPRSCLFVIASDFYEDLPALDAAVRRLRFERHDVLALHVADPMEEEFTFTDPGEFLDRETAAQLKLDPMVAAKAYRAAFLAHRAAVAESFNRCGFDHVAVRTDGSPLAALGAYLARRSGRK